MKIHFIAIGGSVMHQLAIALKRKNYQVSGSDDEIFEPARSNLQKEGILPPAMGWFPEKLDQTLDAVILGMHAKEDNPELLAAKQLGIKIFSFPEYIYHESRDKIRVAIGGSHGKTSTTAMVMHVL
jgi:UDP-N-acetylmuramate: L-alanyl-gamma-D-glutamyl-meso-diaminopimelate ligase